MDRFTGRQMVVLVWALAVGLCASGQGRIIHVDDDAVGLNDGSSWGNAFVYLQDALAAANAGDEIRVAQGIYRPDQGADVNPGDREAMFSLVSGVALIGGYAGVTGQNPDVCDIGWHATILSGDLKGDDGPDFSNVGDNSCYGVVNSLSNDAATLLKGVTITGGWAYGGAGIRSLGSDLRMERCTVVRNKTIGTNGDGAGMHNSGGSPVLRECVFRDNFAWGNGGGFWNEDGDPTFVDCLFEANTVEKAGGGLYSRNGTLTLERCRFWENQARDGAGMYAFPGDGSTCVDSLFVGNSATRARSLPGSGGGVFIGSLGSSMAFRQCSFEENSAGEGGGLAHAPGVDNRSALVLTRCSFSRNTAGRGGALDSSYGALRAADCVFEGNVATGTGGGAVSARDGGGRGDSTPIGPGPTLVRCRFAGNRAQRSPGGGLYNDNSYTTLVNCLFAGNVARDGGGCFSRGASPTLTHCTLAQNWGGPGSGLSDETGGTVLDHCIVWGNSDAEMHGSVLATYSNVGGGWPGEGNIDVDPCFVALGSWSRVDDAWTDGDYHLKSQAGRWDPNGESWVQDEVTSPCIDAGDPLVPVGDEPLPNGGIVNLGAYGGTTEASKTYLGDPLTETHIGAVVMYVDDDADGAGDGSSWSDAFTALEDAIGVALEGDEIRVAQGLYTPTGDPLNREARFELKPGTVVRGGYAGLTEAEPDIWDPNGFVTILSGDIDHNDVSDDPDSREGNSYHVVSCVGRGNQAVLEGVVVTGGNANKTCSHCYGDYHGGGLVCRGGCSPHVIDCVFVDNRASSGGAVCLPDTSGSSADDPTDGSEWQPVFTRCLFIGNRASRGGAVSNGRRWHPVFARCLWENNVAEHDGGAIESRIRSDLTLTHCVFRRNDAGGRGGALSAHSVGNIQLVNCLLVANTAADTGGAIAYPDHNYVNRPQVHRFLNCTFYGNTSPTLYHPPSRSVKEPDGSWTHLVATIVANCIVDGSIADPISDTPISIEPSRVAPEIITSLYEPGPDPQFVDPFGPDGVLGTEDDDFRLASDSPALNSGSNDTEPPLPALDLDGNPRIIDGTVDPGAYESPGVVSPEAP